MNKQVFTRQSILIVTGFFLMAVTLFASLIFVPTEKEMGIVQRIFYFHVPLAWNAFLAFFIVFIGSILYLWKRDEKWDVLAHASAELGVLYSTLVLITGPIWARPIWGAWWTWDVRLTSTLVLWLIYLAYLMVRSYASEESRGARLAAVVGIVGFLDVPIVALAIQLWRGQHPSPVIFSGGLAPAMTLTLVVSLISFTVLYAGFLVQNISQKALERQAKRLRYIINK